MHSAIFFLNLLTILLFVFNNIIHIYDRASNYGIFRFRIPQVSQFTYLGCSISYQFSSDVEFKLAEFLQLIGIIKRTIFKKVRTETILKIYNTLVLPTFLYGSENWDLTTLQRRRIEAAEMKLLTPLAGYTLYDHKTNDYIRRELRITGILGQAI